MSNSTVPAKPLTFEAMVGQGRQLRVNLWQVIGWAVDWLRQRQDAQAQQIADLQAAVQRLSEQTDMLARNDRGALVEASGDPVLSQIVRNWEATRKETG